MYKFTQEEFESAVADAIDSIPDRFIAELENVVFMVENEPGPNEDPELLGVYDGVDLCERADAYGCFDDFPDAIYIFKGPHERLTGSREAIVEEIRRTVVHEVGHYFGMSEAQIEAMGYE